ncbi:MAG: response regulator transcription factor [Planctomycetota bacterium]|jgi:DNA-binding CsgD family transcriptional regulator
MRHPQHSENEKDVKAEESIFQSPRVALLDENHWSYIQRRYHLSPREIQVAKLVCQGFSNAEIAKVLKIKPGTAKTHLRNIYRRIRAKNKIVMLLKFLHVATKFSAISGITPPIPVIGIEKPVKKPLSLEQVHKEEKQSQ